MLADAHISSLSYLWVSKPVGREGATGALAPQNRPQRSTFLLTNDLNQR